MKKREFFLILKTLSIFSFQSKEEKDCSSQFDWIDCFILSFRSNVIEMMERSQKEEEEEEEEEEELILFSQLSLVDHRSMMKERFSPPFWSDLKMRCDDQALASIALLLDQILSQKISFSFNEKRESFDQIRRNFHHRMFWNKDFIDLRTKWISNEERSAIPIVQISRTVRFLSIKFLQRWLSKEKVLMSILDLTFEWENEFHSDWKEFFSFMFKWSKKTVDLGENWKVFASLQLINWEYQWDWLLIFDYHLENFSFLWLDEDLNLRYSINFLSTIVKRSMKKLEFFFRWRENWFWKNFLIETWNSKLNGSVFSSWLEMIIRSFFSLSWRFSHSKISLHLHSNHWCAFVLQNMIIFEINSILNNQWRGEFFSLSLERKSQSNCILSRRFFSD